MCHVRAAGLPPSPPRTAARPATQNVRARASCPRRTGPRTCSQYFKKVLVQYHQVVMQECQGEVFIPDHVDETDMNAVREYIQEEGMPWAEVTFEEVQEDLQDMILVGTVKVEEK